MPLSTNPSRGRECPYLDLPLEYPYLGPSSPSRIIEHADVTSYIASCRVIRSCTCFVWFFPCSARRHSLHWTVLVYSTLFFRQNTGIPLIDRSALPTSMQMLWAPVAPHISYLHTCLFFVSTFFYFLYSCDVVLAYNFKFSVFTALKNVHSSAFKDSLMLHFFIFSYFLFHSFS